MGREVTVIEMTRESDPVRLIHIKVAIRKREKESRE